MYKSGPNNRDLRPGISCFVPAITRVLMIIGGDAVATVLYAEILKISRFDEELWA